MGGGNLECWDSGLPRAACFEMLQSANFLEARFSIAMLSVAKSSPMSALAWKQQLSQGSLGRKCGYPARRREARSNRASAASLRFSVTDLRCFTFRSRAGRSSKLQLLISPALAPQQLRQLYRVSGSNPRVDRYFSRSPWVHFQFG